MHLKFIALSVMSIIAAFAGRAQDFVQPYPKGNALENNPNFNGTAYLYPLSEVKELNVPMFRPRSLKKYYAGAVDFRGNFAS